MTLLVTNTGSGRRVNTNVTPERTSGEVKMKLVIEQHSKEIMSNKSHAKSDEEEKQKRQSGNTHTTLNPPSSMGQSSFLQSNNTSQNS